MLVPNYPLIGRRHSSKPNLGIPLVLSILSKDNATEIDKSSCLCFLGYRILDNISLIDYGVDEKYIIDEIRKCEKFWLSFKPTTLEEHSLISRWGLSLGILDAYLKCLYEKSDMSEGYLLRFNDLKHVKYHPPSIVNFLRLLSMLCVKKHKKNNNDPTNKLIAQNMVLGFKTSVEHYSLRTEDSYKRFVYQHGEASKCITTTFDVLHEKKRFLKYWKEMQDIKSCGNFFKSLITINGEN
jgi:hypothetical protein